MNQSLRTLQNARFCREEVPHDEGQLFAMHPKTFPQVSPIDRAPQLHFSTLEKTKIDHNPLAYNLVCDGCTGFTVLSSLGNRSVQDLDIHTRYLTGIVEAEDDTAEGVLAVKFIMGRDLAVTRPSPDSC